MGDERNDAGKARVDDEHDTETPALFPEPATPAAAKKTIRRLTDAEVSRLFRALLAALEHAEAATTSNGGTFTTKAANQVRRTFGLRHGLTLEQVRAVERRGEALLQAAAIASAAVDAADPSRMPTEPAPPCDEPAPAPTAPESPRALGLALLVEPLARAACAVRELAAALADAHDVVRSLVTGRQP